MAGHTNNLTGHPRTAVLAHLLQSRDVEDQRDAAVAENGGGGVAVEPAVVGFEALDHHLLLAEHFVDHQSEPAAILGFQQHLQALGGAGNAKEDQADRGRLHEAPNIIRLATTPPAPSVVGLGWDKQRHQAD